MPRRLAKHTHGCLYECIQRGLDQEGSDLISGLMNWWIQKFSTTLGGGVQNCERWGLVGGGRSLKACPWGLNLALVPCC
jgi:hypothetical protein